MRRWRTVSNATLSEYENAVPPYIQLIVLKKFSLHSVHDAEVRKFSRFDVSLAKRTVAQVILTLVELVEQRVAEEMKSTAGAVLFDGWSCNGTHYVAVLASYCISMPVRENATTTAKQVPRLALLASSPMGRVAVPDEECTSNAEATSFNAEAHLQFFEEVFSFYEQQYKKVVSLPDFGQYYH